MQQKNVSIMCAVELLLNCLFVWPARVLVIAHGGPSSLEYRQIALGRNSLVLSTFSRAVLERKGLKNIQICWNHNDAIAHLRYKVVNFPHLKYQTIKQKYFWCDDKIRHIVKRPILWLSVLQNFKDSACSRDEHLNWATWTLSQPHYNLSTEIFVNYLRIYSMQASRCRYNLTVAAKSSENCRSSITLCGIYTNVTIFPSDQNLVIRLFHFPMYDFQCSLRFNVISAQVTKTKWTTKTQDTYEVKQYMTFHFLVKKITTLLWIVAHKYLVIQVSFRQRGKLIYCDGPGLTSGCVEIKAPATCVSKSFQIVMRQTENILTNMEPTWRTQHVTHGDVQVAAQSNKQITIDCSKSSLQACFKKIRVRKAQQMYFNVTVTYYSFQGDNGSDCLFGGLALYEIRTQYKRYRNTNRYIPVKEISSLSKNCLLSHQFQWSHLYVEALELFIVGFAYCTLNTKISVSLTSCRPVKINVCIIKPCHCRNVYNHQKFVRVCMKDNNIYNLLSRALQVHIGKDMSCAIIQLTNEPSFHLPVPTQTGCGIYHGQAGSAAFRVRFDPECQIQLEVFKELFKNHIYDVSIDGYLSPFWNAPNTLLNVSTLKHLSSVQTVVFGGRNYILKDFHCLSVNTGSSNLTDTVHSVLKFLNKHNQKTIQRSKWTTERKQFWQTMLNKFLKLTGFKPKAVIHNHIMTQGNMLISTSTKFTLHFWKIYPISDPFPVLQATLSGLGSWVHVHVKPTRTGLAKKPTGMWCFIVTAQISYIE